MRGCELLTGGSATLNQQFPILELKMQASLDQFLVNCQKSILPPLVSNSTSQSPSIDALIPSNGIMTISPPQNSKSHNHPISHNKNAMKKSPITYYSSSESSYLIGLIKIRNKELERKRKRFQEIEAIFQPPAWLSNRTWQCMYSKDLSALRWNFNIQTYRTLDQSSEFYESLVDGDVVGVQMMLQNKTAFVNDYFGGQGIWCVEGTPLHVSFPLDFFFLSKANFALDSSFTISSSFV